eukprot:gene6179-6893_t
MDKPSPVKSRPHSAASTPKIPVRSALINKLQHNDKDHHYQRLRTNTGDSATEINVKEQQEGQDEYKERPHEKMTKSGQDPVEPTPQHDQLSMYEERETCCTYKIRNSFVLCCGFLCFGASMAIMGPTVLELGCLIGTDVGTMSWVFFSQACSALLGAICSGFIIDRRFGPLITLTSMHGLFGGFQDTATNLRMIIMHGQEVPPYLQTLFFFYGAGAFLSPIVAGNFLSDECNKGDADVLNEFAFARRKKRHNGIGKGHWILGTKEDGLHLSSANVSHHEIIRIESSNVHYSYWIIAILHVAVVFALFYLYFTERKERLRRLEWEIQNSDDAGSNKESLSASYSDDSMSSIRSEIDPEIRGQVICITVWIAIMVFISDGLQGSFGSYIYTYAIKSGNNITPDDAAYLNSLFWGSVALGRLFAIFISIYVSPKIMLFVDIAGCLASTVVMFVMRHHVISLWIGTATFGLCLSNIFPTSVSMAEGYFRLTGTITCIFVVCSGSGEMTVPLIIGKLFDVIGPAGFLGISCILCFAAVGVYVAVIITGRGLSRKQIQLELSRRDSQTGLDDTQSLLSDEEKRHGHGQLQLHLDSESSSESNKPAPTKDDTQLDDVKDGTKR